QKRTSETPRYVRVWLPAIEIGRVYARGRAVNGAPTLEAQVTGIRGSVLAVADTCGIVSLHVREPGAVWGSFDGYVGGVQVDSVARVNGDRISVTVDVPRAKPSELRALVKGWPVSEDTAAQLQISGKLPNLHAYGRVNVGAQTVVSAEGPI